MRGLHRVSSPLRGGYLHSALLGTTAKCLEITRSRTNGNDMRLRRPENVIHRFGDTRFPRSSALR